MARSCFLPFAWDVAAFTATEIQHGEALLLEGDLVDQHGLDIVLETKQENNWGGASGLLVLHNLVIVELFLLLDQNVDCIRILHIY